MLDCGTERVLFPALVASVSQRRSGSGHWHNDLPVFISCDTLLQAWHRTYDAILEETEETYLINSAQTILDGMASQLTVASAEVGNGVLQDSLRDADYFIAVARSLLAGTNNPPVPTVLGQDARVAATLADIQADFRPNHRREISRSRAHARLGHENAEHSARFVDATAARHYPLRQTILHWRRPLFLTVRFCRAAGRLLAALGGDRISRGGPDCLSAL